MSFQSQNSGIGRGAFDYSFPRVPFPLDPSFHLENVKRIRVCVWVWVWSDSLTPDCRGPPCATFGAWAAGVPSLSRSSCVFCPF